MRTFPGATQIKIRLDAKSFAKDLHSRRRYIEIVILLFARLLNGMAVRFGASEDPSCRQSIPASQITDISHSVDVMPANLSPWNGTVREIRRRNPVPLDQGIRVARPRRSPIRTTRGDEKSFGCIVRSDSQRRRNDRRQYTDMRNNLQSHAVYYSTK